MNGADVKVTVSTEPRIRMLTVVMVGPENASD
jgi:hypothetical protein